MPPAFRIFARLFAIRAIHVFLIETHETISVGCLRGLRAARTIQTNAAVSGVHLHGRATAVHRTVQPPALVEVARLLLTGDLQSVDVDASVHAAGRYGRFALRGQLQRNTAVYGLEVD